MSVTSNPVTRSQRQAHSILVAELNDVVPRRLLSLPNLYVALTTMPIESRFSLLKEGHGPEWLTGRIVSLRHDLSQESIAPDRDMAMIEKATLVRILRKDGYTVNRNTDVWTVYVIELDSSATKNPGEGYVYVGETKKDPNVRSTNISTGPRTKRQGFTPPWLPTMAGVYAWISHQ